MLPLHESLSTFEENSMSFLDLVRSNGLKLTVKKKGMEEVANDIKKMNKRGASGRGKFSSFNCVASLPRMGRRSRRHAIEVCKFDQELCQQGKEDGACENLENDLEFKSFFDRHLVHYKALLESIESHFPNPQRQELPWTSNLHKER